MEDKKKSSIENRKSKIRYSFPTVSKCPRCGGTQTRATSTQGKVQYRKCLAPICGKRYNVIGTKIKNRKENSNVETTNNKTNNESADTGGETDGPAGQAPGAAE